MNSSMNWENLKYFMALAKAGRLKKAADLLGSNHSTVYRRIKSFEEEIDTKLFESTPTGYHLSAAGEKLYKSTEDLENKMDEITRTIKGIDNTLKGNICITTTASIANTVLPKVLLGFKKKWPHIFIDLRVSNQHLNLSKREADIAIRPSSDVPPHLIGRKLGYIKFSVMGSKGYLKNRPLKMFLDNLSQHDLLGLDDTLGHLRSKQWLDKLDTDQSKIYRFDNLTTMAYQCNAGLGVGLLPEYFQITQRNLNIIFSPKEDVGSDLWILTHRDMIRNPKIKVAMEFMATEIKKELSLYLK